MKKLILLIGLLFYLGLGESSAQNTQLRLTVEASQQVSNFMFLNSEGQKDNDYKAKLTGAYRVGYTVRWKAGPYFRNTIGLRNAGATYENNSINNDWSLQYVDIQLGLGYLFDFESLDLYADVSGYNAHLMRANQRLNDINYNLISSEQFVVNEFGLIGRFGINMDLSYQLDLNVGLSYTYGLTNLENAESNQTTKNRAPGFDLGIAFKID